RCLQTLFELPVCQRRFYTFMASSKLPWERLRTSLWSLIPYSGPKFSDHLNETKSHFVRSPTAASG
ncbi:MAG TPA: hypothetical protein ENK06_07805, partial [Gammaproteobacteria bacterium]|nr:hypothetical protein [Gammaproteobacteria bacterium]